MDSRIGLDFIVENPEYIRKLAAALDTSNTTVKKQVFELLSALCVYNEEGHARALETLEQYKKLKNERYRLSVIVKELDRAAVVEYQTALVAFINCIVISTSRLSDRTRLRNEFVGCHLLPVLNNLRKCAEAEPELAVQLDVFDEQRESDEAQNLQGPHGVDLSSPLDVFYAILKQVNETPQEVPFLAILQHLLRVDNREPISNIVWDTAERLVHRATLLESRDQASRLLRTPSFNSFAGVAGVAGVAGAICTPVVSTRRTQCCTCGGAAEVAETAVGALTSAVPPPPPPPPLAPPPPPPPGAHYQHSTCSARATPHHLQLHPGGQHDVDTHRDHSQPQQAQVHSQLHNHQHHQHTQRNMELLQSPLQQQQQQQQQQHQQPPTIKLPQQEIPQPKIKMKTFNWNKIPSNKVVGKDCIWQQVACTHEHSPMEDMDWTEMEGLFCQQIATPSAHSSPKLGIRSDTLDRRLRKDNSEITLLDGKRSLNVNIFLKQFRSSNEDIVQLIKDGAHDDIGAEKLKGLLKILPEVDELDMLKLFDGDFNKLGNAEKFIIQLTNLPKYKLRIESMLLKEEFAANMSYLEPSIKSMIIAAQDLMTNKPLKEVLYMILVVGNFLNSGGYAGDAAGVKLSSLQKITDIRANKPNMNLIHFVATQAEKRNKELLVFTENINVLEDAAKTTVEQLHNEINALDVRIKKIRKQIDNPSTEIDIKQQMTDFLLVAEREVANLQRVTLHLEEVRRRLAEFFCEDTATFKLEECFRVFHGFYCKWRQAVGENERRRANEEQAVIRRRQREELLATKRRQMGSDLDANYMDTQIYDSKTGFPMKKGKRNPSAGNLTSEEDISIAGSPSTTRRRLGSFNGGQSSDGGVVTGTCQTVTSARDDHSPDVTPNGSLRRRRSRVLSEEDEGNLIDFLRASGHDNNRERKSWGSLDRSWARRARGVSARKRPALLTPELLNGTTGAQLAQQQASFMPVDQNRERPSSPRAVPAVDATTPTGEMSGVATRPREWKQKIESWLKANESGTGGSSTTVGGTTSGEREQSYIERKNCRSMELDSESDRSNTLDTLPEGKQVYSDSQSNYRRAYPDWKPSYTIDSTDVVSAMETVEEVQAPYVKDKSAWRKSNLNVANSTESTRQRDYNHSYSNTSIEPPVTKSNTDAENDQQQQWKELSSALGQRPAAAAATTTDRLTVYIRRSSSESPELSSATGLGGGQLDPNNVPDSQSSPLLQPVTETTDGLSNKDIDQDNIETPPTIRRIFMPTPTEKREPVPPSPCKRMINRAAGACACATSTNPVAQAVEKKNGDSEPVLSAGSALGDGQFDRFSVARRTRRFKRNVDTVDTTIAQTTTPANDPPSLTTDTQQDHMASPTNTDLPGIVLQQKQEPMVPIRKYNNISPNVTIINTNACNDDICKENGESINNDEGFEETQSLQSEESPVSQGESSAKVVSVIGRSDAASNVSSAATAAMRKLSVGKPAAQQPLLPPLVTRFQRNSNVRQSAQEPIIRNSSSSRIVLSALTAASADAANGVVRRTSSVRRAPTSGAHVEAHAQPRRTTTTGTRTAVSNLVVAAAPGPPPPRRSAPPSTLKLANSNNQRIAATGNAAHLQSRSSAASVSTTNNMQHSNAKQGANRGQHQAAVRSNGLSFMKPTASSTTKTTTATVLPSRLHSTFKLKY